MLRYLVRRLLLLIPILLGVSLLIFFWIRALPGSPAESLLGERATPALVQVYRHRYGLAFDHASLVASLIGISIPIFFLAIILKYIFAIRIGWLPSVGRISITN